MHLSGVVASVAVVPGALALLAARRSLPLPITLALAHIAGTGFAVAISASAPCARYTTSLLGKVLQLVNQH